MDQSLYEKVHTQLELLSDVLANLSTADFVQSLPILSDATIGEHVRHVIEMFYCAINNYEFGVINYDKRERNMQIQSDIAVAKGLLIDLHADIIKDDRKMLIQVPSGTGLAFIDIETNYLRELLYNLEHCVHHMALIRIGLQCLMPQLPLSERFGVADSTVAFRANA
jgi:hypothetical protein